MPGLMTQPQWHHSDLDQLHQGTHGTAAKSSIEATHYVMRGQGFSNPGILYRLGSTHYALIHGVSETQHPGSTLLAGYRCNCLCVGQLNSAVARAAGAGQLAALPLITPQKTSTTC